MITIDKNNLSSLKQDFINILGSNFINTADLYLQGLKFPKTFFSEQKQQAKAHPFYKILESYYCDIEQTSRNNCLHISRESLFLFNLLYDIKTLEKNKVKNHQRIINSIINPNTFYSSVFEAHISAKYSNLYNVEVLQETAEKSPDLLINLNRDKVYVECKSLEDMVLKNNSQMQTVFFKLQKISNKLKQSNMIIIKLGNKIDGNISNQIIQYVELLLKENKQGVFQDNDLKIEVSISKINEWDKLHCSDINVNHPENCIFELQAQPVQGIIKGFKNLILTGAEFVPQLDFEKRLIDEINKARKQLPKGHCNILHVQLPLKLDNQFEGIIKNNAKSIELKLENNTKNINSIILSNSMTPLNFNIHNEQIGKYYIIKNNKALINLPEGFLPIGSSI